MTALQIRIVNEKENRDGVVNILLAVLLMMGMAWTVWGAFVSIGDYWWLYGIAGSVVCVLFLLLKRSRWRKYILPAGGILTAGFLLFGILLAKDGFLVLANDVLAFLTGKNGKIYLDFYVENPTAVYLVAAGMTAVLAFVTAAAIWARNRLVLFFLSILVAAGQMAGFFLSDGGILLFAAGCILFLVPEKREAGKKRAEIRHACSRVCVVFLAFVVAGMGGYMLYHNEASLEDAAKKLKNEMHEMRYDTDSVSMPEGDLADLGYWKKDGADALEVVMDTPQKLYLRGMIGEVYTGLSWERLSAETYQKQEDTFYWLHKLGYYSQSSIAKAVKLIKEDVKEEDMVIRNINACKKYKYLPYGLSGEEQLLADSIGDASILAKEEEVKLSYLAGSIPQWYETELLLVDRQEEEDISEYLETEQAYSKFVYENYLQMTNASVGVCERIIGDTAEKMTLASIMDLIQERLNLLMEYNERITTRNGKNDFLQYTLEHQRKGYSVHYATAATMMLRYCGIPARYVEGYFVSALEAAEYVAGQTITISEDHAHAWAEYYLDGVGWIPFEVTPGYIDEEEILTAKKIAAGTEGTTGVGRSFAKNNLNYKPPVKSPTEKETEGEDSTFRLSLMDVAKILLVMLLVLFIVIFIRILMRYQRLSKILSEIDAADNRTAIAMEYGYAKMLLERAKMAEPDEKNSIENSEKVRLLNQEALFSDHVMSDEDRKTMTKYRNDVLETCKNTWNLPRNLWNHYILWLYR